MAGIRFGLHFAVITLSVTTALAQIQWTKYSGNPIISPGQLNPNSCGFDYWQAWMPMVLYENGLCRMFYVGYGYDPYFGAYSVGYSISEDGTNWAMYHRNPVVHAGSPGSFDDTRIWGGTVLKVGSTYRMYYGGYSTRFSVGLAESQDAIHWTKRPAAVLSPGTSGSWDSDGTSAPSVIREMSGAYTMWYTGARGTTIAIGLATSTDGITWTKYSGNPVMTSNPSISWESSMITDSRVVKVDSTYHMFYFGKPTNLEYQIGYAYSTDGINWTKYSGNPVLPFGPPGSWDGISLSQSWIIYKDGEFKMWYAGKGSNAIFQIGYATAPLTPTDVSPTPQIPREFNLQQNYPNPFNPSTTIEYEVPHQARITLKIYNTLGQDVATLVDEERMPGTYSAVWDAKGVASGTYWSRMAADGKSVVQKMILIK